MSNIQDTRTATQISSSDTQVPTFERGVSELGSGSLDSTSFRESALADSLTGNSSSNPSDLGSQAFGSRVHHDASLPSLNRDNAATGTASGLAYPSSSADQSASKDLPALANVGSGSFGSSGLPSGGRSASQGLSGDFHPSSTGVGAGASSFSQSSAYTGGNSSSPGHASSGNFPSSTGVGAGASSFGQSSAYTGSHSLSTGHASSGNFPISAGHSSALAEGRSSGLSSDSQSFGLQDAQAAANQGIQNAQVGATKVVEAVKSTPTAGEAADTVGSKVGDAKSGDHVTNLVSGVAGVVLTAPLAAYEAISHKASTATTNLQETAQQQGLTGVAQQVQGALSGVAASAQPYVASASQSISSAAQTAQAKINATRDPSAPPVSQQASNVTSSISASASSYASSASATVSGIVHQAEEALHHLGERVGLVSPTTYATSTDTTSHGTSSHSSGTAHDIAHPVTTTSGPVGGFSSSAASQPGTGIDRPQAATLGGETIGSTLGSTNQGTGSSSIAGLDSQYRDPSHVAPVLSGKVVDTDHTYQL